MESVGKRCQGAHHGAKVTAQLPLQHRYPCNTLYKLSDGLDPLQLRALFVIARVLTAQILDGRKHFIEQSRPAKIPYEMGILHSLSCSAKIVRNGS